MSLQKKLIFQQNAGDSSAVFRLNDLADRPDFQSNCWLQLLKEQIFGPSSSLRRNSRTVPLVLKSETQILLRGLKPLQNKYLYPLRPEIRFLATFSG